MGLIYKISCDINNKNYVGQTIQSLKIRMGCHRRDAKRNDYPLYRAIKKYGWEHFKVEILEDNISLENLNERELYWGKKFNALIPNGYSLILGSGNNKIISSEICKKISISKKGSNNPMYGKTHTIKMREEMGIRMKKRHQENAIKKENFLNEIRNKYISGMKLNDIMKDYNNFSGSCIKKIIYNQHFFNQDYENQRKLFRRKEVS